MDQLTAMRTFVQIVDLVKGADGKIGFEFEARAPKEPAAKKVAAKKVAAKAPAKKVAAKKTSA